MRIRQLVDPSAEVDFAEPPENAVVIDDGDLILAWSGSLEARLWNRGRALLNQHLFRVDPRREVDRRWLLYVLEVGTVRLAPLMHGSAMTHITRDMLRRLTVDVPSPARQLMIASFLDAQTAGIAALIEKKDRLIGLLRMRQTAIIRLAVTGGLGTDAPRRESGVEWIGSVPEHWQIKKIKRLCQVRRGASPRPIDDPIYFDDDGEYAWVRISDVTAAGRYLRTTEQRLSGFGSSKSVRLEPGELFVSIAGTVGKPVITKIKCCIHDGFVYFVGLKENREFLYYVLVTGAPYGGLGKLGTQLNLNTDTIGDIRVPVPPPEEQETIAAYLDRESATIDDLLGRIRKQIDLLIQYRLALITAAVTGELDPARAA